MRDRCRFCIRRAAGLLCSVGFALIVGLTPQLSSAAVELAVELETVESTASGTQRRTVPLHRAAATLTPRPSAGPGEMRPATSLGGGLPKPGHVLPNGSRAPLIC